MSVSLSSRRIALVCVLFMAAAAVLALRALPGADAQEPPPPETFVFSGIQVTATNGHASLGPGTGFDSGVLGIACTGASPRGGTPRVPGMVVTELLETATRLRIVQANAAALTGTVLVNCVVEFEPTPLGAATADRLRAAETAG
jgi:hypothetical protein